VLVPIIFIVALMLALTGAVLENAAHAERVEQHAAVASYSNVSIADGVADFSHGLAQFVERRGTGGPWPRKPIVSALKSACDARAAQDCPFRYYITATITAASAETETSGSDAAPNLQAAVIGEQRVSAIVSVTVTGSTGTPELGTRTRYLTYRVFETAPFAMISGSGDTAAANGTQSEAQGDSGGSAGDQTPGASKQRAADFDDTRIHVRLTCGTVIPGVVPNVNDQQVAGNDGLPWGNTANAAHEAPCTTTETPADVFRDEQWTNGDTNSTGWTR
jgi:hypothetical protein